MVVVYDPTAGFVTGGGWIEPAAGSCQLTPACAAASGRATFGFVARYRKGATVPDGNAEFVFHAGGFTFRSDAYDWLVISGSKAQFKGRGSVNDATGYGFLLTAVDGGSSGSDRFRIKVWSLSSGLVVFDNVGGADSAEPTAIGGGSIVLHKPPR
jgi:hypothetical protein